MKERGRRGRERGGGRERGRAIDRDGGRERRRSDRKMESEKRAIF